MKGFHLAQLNVARLKAPLDDPLLADFMAALEPVNAVADDAPGFVWRLQTEDGNATCLRVLGDDMMLVNMSVWESLEALTEFVRGAPHMAVMRRRRAWFERMAEAYLVLWWTPPGLPPTMSEGERRLLHLRRVGPSSEAFTFGDPFPAPSGDVSEGHTPSLSAS